MKAGQFQEADRLYSCLVRRQPLKSVGVPMVDKESVQSKWQEIGKSEN